MKIRVLHPRRPMTRSTPWRLAQQFFLFAGLLAVGFTAYTYVARYAYQTYASWQFDRSLARHATAARGSQNSPQSPLPAVALPSLIGRITIPRLGISAMVKEGIDDGTLDLAAGHIPSTALPGQPGNVGVAAHRDNLFRNLRNIKPDDAITLATLDSTYVYRVVSVRVVNPTNVSVLAASADEKTLTLVTCYPFYFVGHAPKRFIVRSRQVANIPQPQQARLSGPLASGETPE